MAASTGVQVVPEGRLRLSRSPTAELAAAAYLAQQAAGLDAADFVIVAVAPGTATDALARDVEKAAGAAKAK